MEDENSSLSNHVSELGEEISECKSELGDKMGLLNNDTSGFKSKIGKSFEFTGKIVKANADFSYPLGIEVAFWNFLEGDDVGAYSSWRW